MAQYDVDLREYWRILRKRKAVIILITILAGLSSYGFAKFNEPVPRYEARTAVKINRTTNLAGFLTGAYWYAAESTVTQAFIITSFPVLSRTAKIIGWIPADMTEAEIQKSKSALAKINRLKAMITANQEEGTNIINISAVSENPEEVAQVANAAARAFREYNILEKNRQTFDTKAFIEEQLRITSENLKRAEQNLKRFKENTELLAIDQQAASTLTELLRLEDEYEKVKRRKKNLAAQIKRIEQTARDLDHMEGVFFPEDVSTVFRELGNKLHGLILKRKALLFDFTEKHPKVVEVNDQIRGVIDSIKNELVTLIQILETRESDFLQKINQFKMQIQDVPEKALQLSRLERELNIQETLYSQLKAKYQETLIQESGRIEEVVIITPALVPTRPINIPSKILIVVTGVVMGLIVGVLYTFIAETLDTSIGTIEDVESLLHVPVLGVIPEMENGYAEKNGTGSKKARGHDLVTHYDPKSLSAEAFRTLRSNIQFVGLEKKGKSFLISSSFIQEGKTFNVVNLALSMAQAGNRVLLVEADLRRPVIHKMFGLSRTPGLTDYVLGNYQWNDIKKTITDVMLGDFELEDLLGTPGLDNLNIITAGTHPPNPSEILRSARFREFLEAVYHEYDFIFIDAPPILPVADASEIAPLVDGIILVYKVGKIGRGVLKRAKISMDNINANVLGVILNNVRPETGPDYFKYHTQYHYGYPDQETAAKQKTQRSRRRPGSMGKILPILVVITALGLLALGLFWEDALEYIMYWRSFL